MMNPSSAGLWNNPPPPGIDAEEEGGETFYGASVKSEDATETTKQVENTTLQAKQAESVERVSSYEKSTYRRRSRSRSYDRRRSRDRSRRRRHRSRSRSRGRYRRSRSRSRGSYRRYRSTSRSRSRSSSYDRYRRRRSRDRRYRRSRSRRYSRSSSRSRSRSRTHRRYRSKRHSRGRDSDRNSQSPLPAALENDDVPDIGVEDDEPEPPKENAFKNDGSFLEMFKKMQEEQKAAEASKPGTAANDIKKPLPTFGKRRGGRVLKTGLVEKTKMFKNPDGTEPEPQDAWSIYLKEVKRYKEACCDEDSKTRPLIK